MIIIKNFNPRSPWGERRQFVSAYDALKYFNPRSPWGERPFRRSTANTSSIYFNPRSPWGERPEINRTFTAIVTISIHAPRGGSDITLKHFQLILILFQSTLPVGGATKISNVSSTININFNPRSPWGERLKFFLTTFSKSLISIHAPRGGSDYAFSGFSTTIAVFQSTLPVGGATPISSCTSKNDWVFQSTLPVGGATAAL